MQDGTIEVTVYAQDDDDPELFAKILQPMVVKAVEDNFVSVTAAIQAVDWTDDAIGFTVVLGDQP